MSNYFQMWHLRSTSCLLFCAVLHEPRRLRWLSLLTALHLHSVNKNQMLRKKKNKKAEFRTQNHDCDEDPECSAKCQSTGISNSQSRRRWLHSSTPQTSPLELKTDQWGRATNTYHISMMLSSFVSVDLLEMDRDG